MVEVDSMESLQALFSPSGSTGEKDLSYYTLQSGRHPKEKSSWLPWKEERSNKLKLRQSSKLREKSPNFNFSVQNLI